MIFRNWVLQNFPFIENDFDALTDYELFCKVMGYIKNYQKEFDRIEKEVKDFEEYLSTVDIEKTVHEILSEELPELESSILTQVDYKINALRNEINGNINELTESINNSLGVIDNRLDSVENGNINIYDPTSGNIDTLSNTLQNIYGMIINTIPTAITCLEFDNLELTATDFDAYEITAINFDLDAKEILV